jgi:SAM-dependent methyltransferase
MSAPPVVHRGAASGGQYDGIQIHAAAGIHEYALRLVERAQPRPARVLDAGCGSGAFTARLAEAGYDVVAADVETSDYNARPPVVTWDLAGADVAGELRGAFDVAFAIEVLEHVENPLQGLRNLHQVLRPSGLLIVSTPHIGHPRSRLKFLARGAPAYFGYGEYVGTGHRTLLSDWLLRRHLEAVGFEDIEMSYAGEYGLTGASRIAYRALMPVFGLLGMMPKPRDRDGSAVFAQARRL